MNSRGYRHTLALMIVIMTTTGCAKQETPAPPPATPPPVTTESTQPPPVEELAQSTTSVDDAAGDVVNTVAADNNVYLAECGGEAKDLEKVLEPIVGRLSGQLILYSQNPADEWRDCSGNFLRLSSYLAEQCPEHEEALVAPPGVPDYKPGGPNTVPFEVAHRSTRDVARWYHEQGRFMPIYYDRVDAATGVPEDLRKYRHLIRPGAVLWFSRGQPVSQEGVDALFNRTGSGSHINHMGTVTSVRPGDGEVLGYDMFHGHGKPGKTPADVTKQQYWKMPPRLNRDGKKYPALGYWDQRLVGIGTIVPVVNASLN